MTEYPKFSECLDGNELTAALKERFVGGNFFFFFDSLEKMGKFFDDNDAFRYHRQFQFDPRISLDMRQFFTGKCGIDAKYSLLFHEINADFIPRIIKYCGENNVNAVLCENFGDKIIAVNKA